MEKLNTTKIEAITISVNYSDYLSQCISNKEKLDRWIVITQEDDLDCIKVCEDNDIEYICSKRIYEDGSYFAKGKAINEGLELLDKDGWILHLDSDIKLPSNFRDVVKNNCFDKTALYWTKRYYKNYKEMKWITPDGTELQACGFFQLWHNSKRKDYPSYSNTASWDDMYMRDSINHLIKLPLKCVDVSGYYGRHHFGRGVEIPSIEEFHTDPLGKYIKNE